MAEKNYNRNRGRYDVYAAGYYLCTINQTLRVLQSAFDCERCTNAMQLLIDQHPTGLLIMPDGEHKKSAAVSLADIAPRIVSKKAQKRPIHTYLQGADFSKKGGPKNKRLQASKRVNSEKIKSGEVR
jgi:hypothetical protein